MRLALFYDTETTGLPLFNQPSDDVRQPHIVQLAAALVDLDTQRTIASMDVTVRPDGWVIPDEVAAIHGITTEHAAQVGVSESIALGLFLDLWGGNKRIAHNEQFDARIIRIAMKRLDDADEQAWSSCKTDCTAALATPICKLPPTDRMRAAGRFHFKTANLTEAHMHFFGKPFEGAHSAIADVQACMAVYFAIKQPVLQPA